MGKYTDCKVRENADIRKIALILEKRKRRNYQIGMALRDYLNKQQAVSKQQQAVSKQQQAVSKKEND